MARARAAAGRVALGARNGVGTASLPTNAVGGASVPRKCAHGVVGPANHCQDMPPARIATVATATTITILVFAGIAASAFGAPRTTLAARPPACDTRAPFVRRP